MTIDDFEGASWSDSLTLYQRPYRVTALGGFPTFPLQPGKAWLRQNRTFVGR
jgi:hypothetical protein